MVEHNTIDISSTPIKPTDWFVAVGVVKHDSGSSIEEDGRKQKGCYNAHVPQGAGNTRLEWLTTVVAPSVMSILLHGGWRGTGKVWIQQGRVIEIDDVGNVS